MKFGNIFITVGTTNFDRLIEKVCSEDFAKIIIKFGCTHLTIQYGNGNDFNIQQEYFKNIIVKKYRLKPNLLDDIRKADLIISHAGAGTCMEVLREHKPLVVVINQELMGNHQEELAEQLFIDGHLFYCKPETLTDILINSNFNNLLPYPKGDMTKFIQYLDELMGFR